MIISLDPALLRDSSGQPGSLGRAVLRPRLAAETLPYLALLRVGFAVPAPSPGPRCALTAPFHPYPAVAREAVCFLWHFPWGHPRSALPTTLPCGARTFLPAHLAAGGATTRPSPAGQSILQAPVSFNSRPPFSPGSPDGAPRIFTPSGKSGKFRDSEGRVEEIRMERRIAMTGAEKAGC